MNRRDQKAGPRHPDRIIRRAIAIFFLIGSVCVDAAPNANTIAHKLLLLDATRAGTRIVAVGEYGYVLFSDDDGSNWQIAKSPTQATLTAVGFTDARHGSAVGHDAVILRSTDGGETWTQVHSAPQNEAPLLNLWFENAGHGFAFGAYGAFYETRDGGKSWMQRKVLKTDSHIYGIARDRAGRLFLAGEAGALYRSHDDGRSWEPLKSPYRGSFFGILGLPDGGILVFGLRGKIFRSTDSGNNWIPVNTGSEASLMGGEVLADGTVVLLGHDGVILTSRNAGKTFQLWKHPESKSLIAATPIGNGKILTFGEPDALEFQITLDAQRPPSRSP